eukprot:683119-Pelagomonas_calceolata.AAC.1
MSRLDTRYTSRTCRRLTAQSTLVTTDSCDTAIARTLRDSCHAELLSLHILKAGKRGGVLARKVTMGGDLQPGRLADRLVA